MDSYTPLDELLARKMDRKQFLQHLGLGIIFLFGFGSILKLLASSQRQTALSTSPQPVQPDAYNASVYAGRAKN